MTDANIAMVRIPADTLVDGAVVELSQDANGTVSAEIRIPAPVPVTSPDPQPAPDGA
jgi:hypothetical protein